MDNFYVNLKINIQFCYDLVWCNDCWYYEFVIKFCYNIYIVFVLCIVLNIYNYIYMLF